ncbi:hypothetical protein [Spiroplasma endosymbiont of Atherix ibis]|uniref:hypothetical protein n=1 Tax=Spiroplasma endosymbiont of Atherix ibis TaxID=3066291 RepID=UPI0030CC8CA7
MKKILALFSIISLASSPILLSTQVISCNTWSLVFKDILKKDVESLTQLTYYNIAKECVQIDDNEHNEKENGQMMSTLSLSINKTIVNDTEGMLKKLQMCH